jgi:succinoglycan biosynthesis transport protein ExoP
MAIRQPREQDDFAAEPPSVDLHDYWSIIRRRWRLIAVFIVIGVLAGAAYSLALAPTYTANAQVVVEPVTQGPLNQPAQTASQVNMSTEQAIAQSGPVIQQAAATLKVPASTLESAAASRLSVTVPASTLTTSNVLQIGWKASSRLAAQQGADAFASAYLSYRHHELAGQIAVLQGTLQRQVSSLQTQIGQLSAQLNGTTSATTHQVLNIRLNELSSQASSVEAQLAALPTYNDSGGSVIPAVLPSKPSGFSRSMLLGIGLILGLLIGLAVAFGRDFVDDRIRDAAQLEQRLDAPVLGILPSGDAMASRHGRPKRQPASVTVAVAADPDSRAADAARVFCATLVALASRRNLRVLMVIAADASMSAGLIVAELGVALAESGQRVLLVASDTQGSVLPPIFDVSGNAGLKELLARGGDPATFARSPKQASGAVLPGEVAERLSVLPSGQEGAPPLSVLDAGRMATALRMQREAHDFVLLDAPSAAGSGVLSLAPHVDGVIVLAREAHTRSKDLLSLSHRLSQIGAPVVGGVLIGKARYGRGRRHAPAATSPAASPAGPPAPATEGTSQPASVSRATLPLSLVPAHTARSVARRSRPARLW